MKFFLSSLLLFSLFISETTNSQTLIPKKCYMHLLGSISKEYPVEMNLVKINDTLYGDFSFLQHGNTPLGKETGSIPVYGKMSTIDSYTLKELNSGNGIVFKGKFINSQDLSGILEGSGIPKPLPFELFEKYPEGSVAMDVFFQKAYTPLVKKPKSPVAAIQLALLLPAESANPLISDSLIHLMLVKFTGKPIKISQPAKLLDGMKEVYFENYLGTNEGIYNETMASSFNWQSMKFLHILMNGSHILSFYIDHYAFTGGAHGLQTREFTVVSLWTGKEIQLKDIFKEGSEERLITLISDKIHLMNHMPTNQSLKDAGFFTDTIKPSENFYLTREGIGFYYNQYDIAPYASGNIDIFLPYSELKEVLLTGGAIRELSR